MQLPKIIQGGMGAGVSDWRLARSVSIRGQMGVVSGTALDLILIRRLQSGDTGGHMRRALEAFPYPAISARIIDRYFIEGGKPSDRPFVPKPMAGQELNAQLSGLLVAANFAEVFLAKEGHDGLVGINFLQKIQSPLLASIYGAILAEVDVLLVGAGIPLEIPEVLDQLIQSEPAEMKLHAIGAKKGSTHRLSFDPKDIFGTRSAVMRRPLFLPIVSSVTLASLMVKKCKGKVDGLVIEGPTAGGHNAPPRGKAELSPTGEPVYTPRDAVDLEAIKSLGLPFWLAGSYGSPEKLAEALAAGATGIQVGTLFAFCEESGLRWDLKRNSIEDCLKGTQNVFTDPVASPTGFPFKVLSLPNTLSDPDVYEQRDRKCDLGYLREAYEQPDGALAWRCPAEDPDTYVKHGGDHAGTEGRKCLCNSLMANIGLEQVRKNHSVELPLVTCGDDLSTIRRILSEGDSSYSSGDVIDFLMNGNES